MAERRALDQYMTPRWAIRCVLPVLEPWIRSGLVLEPSCGSGEVVGEVLRLDPKPTVLAVDVDPGMVEQASARFPGATVLRRDYLRLDLHAAGIRPSCIIGNPPYSQVDAFIEKALRDVVPSGVVAFLLRIGQVETKDREKRHQRNRPDIHVFPKRPSFTGDNHTDGTPYGWFIWHANRRPGEPAIWTGLDWQQAYEDCQREDA